MQRVPRSLGGRVLCHFSCSLAQAGHYGVQRGRHAAVAAAAATTARTWYRPHSIGQDSSLLLNGAAGEDYEAIFVLAGGFTSAGDLPPWVIRRLDASLNLQKRQNDFCPIVCLGAGTPHKKPPLSATGHPVHESTSLAKYLVSHGVDPLSIFKEASSYDTVGNAYFALTIHALPAGWKKMAVITSEFHMPRTCEIFKYMFDLASKQRADGDMTRYVLDFLPVADEGVLPEEVLKARNAREAESLKTWKCNSAKLQSMAELHAWLHQTHLCYAVSRQHEFGIPTVENDLALASY